MENKIIQFDLNLISQSPIHEIISELELALSLKFELYDGDLYDDDEVWYCNSLGIQIELHHFPDENIFNLNGETENSLLGEIIEDDTEFIEMSFQVYNKLQEIYPNRKWKILSIEV